MNAEWVHIFSNKNTYDMNMIQRILSQMPFCSFFKDTDLRYQIANNMDYLVSNRYHGMIKGMTDIEVLTDKSSAGFFFEDDMRILQTGNESRYVHRMFTDSDLLYLDICKKPVYDMQRNILGIFGVITDITSSVKESKWKQQQYELMSEITKIDRILLNLQKDFTLMDEILCIIAQYSNADRAYLFEFTDDIHASNTYEYCRKGITSQKSNLTNLDMRDFPYWLETLSRGEHIEILDIENISKTRTYEYNHLKKQDISSLYVVPILITDPRNNKKRFAAFLGVDNPLNKPESTFFLNRLTFSLSMAYTNYIEFNEIRNISMKDLSTNLLNRNQYVEYINKYVPNNRLGCIYIDVNGLHEYNNLHGHTKGDILLKNVADALLQTFGNQQVFRVGGDEFVVLSETLKEHQLKESADKFSSILEKKYIFAAIGISYATGSNIDIQKIIQTADSLMLINKETYYKKLAKG
ncbi:MAG TPA: diguanylate cyclase [Clostridia bacterium]|nr:diguanylate cyclase [Clostridia bacterium]